MKSLWNTSLGAALVIAAAGIANAADDGVITGKITLKGTPPPETEIKMDAVAECKAMHSATIKTKRYVVGANGELANVFVWVKEGVSKKYDPPKTSVLLDQTKCLYVPYVLGVQAGQEMEVRNSDDTLHNVHAMPEVNAGFNRGQATKGSFKHKFDKPEVMVKFKCDVHPWMFAYVGVVPHPFFAVTDESGSYKISGLPAGDYTIEAWHLKGGTQTQKVKVAAGETKADFTIEAKN